MKKFMLNQRWLQKKSESHFPSSKIITLHVYMYTPCIFSNLLVHCDDINNIISCYNSV